MTCPNCGARYRLSPDVVAKGARLKCAACDHRWVPEAPAESIAKPVAAPPIFLPEPVESEVAPPLQPAPTQPELGETPVEAIIRPDTVTESDDDAHDEDRQSHPVRTLIAVILALALAVTAAGLWLGRIDAPGNLGRIPVIGDTLAALVPSGPALKITIAGVATPLPSGGQVLEVTGTITNPGSQWARVPLLKASLVGPGGAVRRWTISPPVAELAPGASATFASTVMGFPSDARTLAVSPSR